MTNETETPTGPAASPAIVPHSALEDVLGLLTGAFLASLGLHLLHDSGAVTGGTAGLSLLLTHLLPVPFGVIFAAVNLPFVVLAIRRMGWRFTLRTAAAVALVAGLSSLHAVALPGPFPWPVYAVLAGNLLCGVGILILFRHRASLGGFNILALWLQDRRGIRAGTVMLVLDLCVVLASFAVLDPLTVLLSAAGAVVLNTVLVFNHRPGRYLA